jgi:hypothetical protein
MRGLCLLPLLLTGSFACAATHEESATLADLFPPQQTAPLANILPVDQAVKWRVSRPANSEPCGVVVFVSPTDSGEPQAGWLEVLERENLAWVAAEGFGNRELSARRVLVAIMGLALTRKLGPVDDTRIYIAGMSGGGRVASQVITEFPRLFTGALYIVGADYWKRAAPESLEVIRQRRYVFLTGERDFNREEMLSVARRYRRAGVKGILVLDLPRYAHEYPTPERLGAAIDYLDTGAESMPR